MLVYFGLVVGVLHEDVLLFLQVYLHQLCQIEFTGAIFRSVCALFLGLFLFFVVVAAVLADFVVVVVEKAEAGEGLVAVVDVEKVAYLLTFVTALIHRRVFDVDGAEFGKLFHDLQVDLSVAEARSLRLRFVVTLLGLAVEEEVDLELVWWVLLLHDCLVEQIVVDVVFAEIGVVVDLVVLEVVAVSATPVTVLAAFLVVVLAPIAVSIATVAIFVLFVRVRLTIVVVASLATSVLLFVVSSIRF